MKYTIGYQMVNKEWRYTTSLNNLKCYNLISDDINDPNVKFAHLTYIRIALTQYNNSFLDKVSSKIFNK